MCVFIYIMNMYVHYVQSFIYEYMSTKNNTKAYTVGCVYGEIL